MQDFEQLCYARNRVEYAFVAAYEYYKDDYPDRWELYKAVALAIDLTGEELLTMVQTEFLRFYDEV